MIVVCPRHEGSFDCTPFCDLCEGEQEYNPEQCSECTNKAETTNDNSRPLCEFCYHAQECPTPKNIEFGLSWFTAEPRARCKKCDFVSAYWECGCELQHACKDYTHN